MLRRKLNGLRVLSVLLLGCEGPQSPVEAWDEEIHWLDASHCQGVSQSRMGYVRANAPSQSSGPQLGEQFHHYIEVELGVSADACGDPAGSAGRFTLSLPEGVELAPSYGNKAQCRRGAYRSELNEIVTTGCSSSLMLNGSGTIEVAFFDPLGTHLGVQAGRSAMVRVPVIARKPIANASLKVVFEDKVLFRLEEPVEWNIPIAIGEVLWDMDSFKYAPAHNSALVDFRLFNWLNEGSVSASLFDEDGNLLHENTVVFPSIEEETGKPARKTYEMSAQFQTPWLLQPLTSYQLQMHFKPEGGSTLGSDLLPFKTTELLFFGLTLQTPDATQGQVGVSPSKAEYPQGYPLGTEIALSATPGSGWRLEHWLVNGNRMEPSNPLRLAVEENLEVHPYFVYSTDINLQTNSKSGGCSQPPQKPSWESLAALFALALFFLRKHVFARKRAKPPLYSPSDFAGQSPF